MNLQRNQPVADRVRMLLLLICLDDYVSKDNTVSTIDVWVEVLDLQARPPEHGSQSSCDVRRELVPNWQAARSSSAPDNGGLSLSHRHAPNQRGGKGQWRYCRRDFTSGIVNELQQ